MPAPEVPIALMIFNRPDLTKKIIEQLSKRKPPILYVIADGPRNDEEKSLCEEAREIALNPPWDCEVVPFARDENKGMVKQFKEGLDFVFEEHDRLIFMEDDHILAPSFYDFAKELLERYSDDEGIGHINFSNFLSSFTGDREASYFHSSHVLVWGFATWKRVWKTYDPSMPEWNATDKDSFLDRYYFSKREKDSYRAAFDLHSENTDPWTYDYQWIFNCLHRNTLSITPSRNLCLNIGFNREDATHNKGDNPFAKPIEDLAFPLTHPSERSRDLVFDRKLSTLMTPSTTNLVTGKILGRIRRLFRKESA